MAAVLDEGAHLNRLRAICFPFNCRVFASNNTCPYGISCRYAHGDIEAEEWKVYDTRRRRLNSRGVCRAFKATGFCEYGEKCFFAHAREDEAVVIEAAIEARKMKKAAKADRKSQKLLQKQQDEDDSNDEGEECGCYEADFEIWIAKKFQESHFYAEKKILYDRAVEIVLKWKERFEQDFPDVFKRIIRGRAHRMLKEFEECVPVIERTMHMVEDLPLESSQVTIVDLCSGFGYLSMFLSEMLPHERVARIVLIDKAFPHATSTIAAPVTEAEIQIEVESAAPDTVDTKHINWSHLKGACASLWPIPLVPIKQDIKSSSSLNFISRVYMQDAPVIVLAVHLCGILSLRAVDLFNRNSSVFMVALKPCCLPNMVHAERAEVFRAGPHAFDAKDVCARGKWVAKSKGKWTGPPRGHLEGKFNTWTKNLFLCLDVSDMGKSIETIGIQHGGGFQNSYIWAHRN